MINRFSQFLVEEEKTVYFTFGRLNPPTRGHEMLLNKLAQAAGKNPYRIYLSKSHDQKKNPLSYNDKIKFSRKMYPKHARQIIKDTTITNVMDIATKLYNDGFVNIVMAVDGPRSREFDILLNKYNGQQARHGFYNFKSIKFINVGERNDASEGIDGVSATKQRNAAKENDFVTFSQGLPKNVSNADAKALFNAVRKGMGLKEQKEFKNHIQLEPVSDLREAYVNNRLFETGDEVVMARNGIVGHIKHLGSNYVIVESKGETWRCWLDDVSKVGENKIEFEDAPYTDPGDDGVLREAFTKTQQHKLDPNVKLKHQVKHATKQYVDVDVDGDVDKADKMKQAKDFGDVAGVPNLTKYLKKRQDIEKKHTQKGVAFESNQPEWGTPESTAKAKKMTPGQNEGLWDNIRARRAAGKPKLKPGDKNYPKTLKIENERKKDSPQDPDIKDRPGTQPKAYHAGLSKAQKIARDRQFKKQSKMSDNDPKAYRPAPGDKTTKTKPSKHTLKYKQMFGEDNVDLVKKRIEREKEMDKRKHDRMMDRARMRDTQKINKETK